jgi:hypothetical protein
VKIWLLVVWNVPEAHHGLMHRFHLRPTTKNPNHYWITYKLKDNTNLERLKIELKNVWLRYGLSEVEHKPTTRKGVVPKGGIPRTSMSQGFTARQKRPASRYRRHR